MCPSHRRWLSVIISVRIQLPEFKTRWRASSPFTRITYQALTMFPCNRWPNTKMSWASLKKVWTALRMLQVRECYSAFRSSWCDLIHTSTSSYNQASKVFKAADYFWLVTKCEGIQALTRFQEAPWTAKMQSEYSIWIPQHPNNLKRVEWLYIVAH